MRVAVIGTGGVGGYFGARLHEGGYDVSFIARGEHLAAMKNKGLEIRSSLGDIRLKNGNYFENTEEIGPVDLVMIAVKLWSTEDAIDAALPLLGPNTGLVSFQNGVLAEELMIRKFGRERVIGGVANIAALIEEPGVIRHNGTMAALYFGELDGSNSARTEVLYEACKKSKIDADLKSDINVAIWEKYIRLVTMSSMTALCRMPIGPIRRDPDTRALLQSVLQEVLEIAAGKGIAFGNGVIEKQMDIIDGYPETMVASMCGDLRRGYRLELPWLAGNIKNLGKELGIATPANNFVYAALKLYENGRPPEAQL